MKGSNPLLKENLDISMSMPTPKNGAAKKPKGKTTRNVIFGRISIFFSEMSMPTNTPVSIRLIVEAHLIRKSYSLPTKLSILRTNNDTTITKANADTNKAFVRFIILHNPRLTYMLFEI
jgi:hypothetical protein